MNVKTFASTKGLVASCCIAALTMACSQQFYNRQQTSSLSQSKTYPNLVEIYADNLQPMHDSLHTIVALTPMAGANVDSLFKGGDKFVIQYPKSLSQALPTGIDVVYINADYATSAIDDCALLEEVTSKDNIKIMIDGSVKNIERFCKKNFNVFNPKTVLMVYENIPPDSSADRDIPSGAFTTMAYGKAYNPISYDMLIESIFDFSVNDKRTVEDFKKAFEYQYDPKSPETIARIAKMEELRKKKYDEAKRLTIPSPAVPAPTPLLLASSGDDIGSLFANTNVPKIPVSTAAWDYYDTTPYCDWNKWNHVQFDDLWGPDNGGVYWNPDDVMNRRNEFKFDKNYTHITNPGEDFHSYGYYRGVVISPAYKWRPEGWVIWALRRLNCVDDKGYFSMRIEKSWSSKAKLETPKQTTVLIGKWAAFNPKTARQGYLDFGITNDYTKSYTLTRTGGLGISIGGDVLGYSIEKKFESSWSKAKTQEVKISATKQNEFWFSACMLQKASPIYGRVEAWTKTRDCSAHIQMRVRNLYASNKDYSQAIQYDLLNEDQIPELGGQLLNTETHWVKSVWKRNLLKGTQPFKNFRGCK